MNELTINLNTNSEEPLYEQIYNYIKNEIQNGHLPFQTKMPSTRSLAIHLDISRSTTQMAYDQLVSEGYIESIPCKGYFVCQIDGLYNLSTKDSIAMPEAKNDNKTFIYDFSPTGIDLDMFPFNAWRKISKNVLINDNKELFNYGDSQGEYELRNTICDYLHQSRGVNCQPQQVVLGSGNEYLVMLINNLLNDNDIIAMENPTYLKAYRTFKSLGRKVVPTSMDSSGLIIDELDASNATIAYVTPSHQYPLGIVMPMKRRAQLLQWANSDASRYIIEDDYDSEFRYKGKPIPALQGNSNLNDKVIYLGTFSKSIAPGIRMNYMVLPPTLLNRYHEKCGFYSCPVSRIDQIIVNSFLQEGYYERHLNKLRAMYKSRHDILLNELKCFGNNFDITGEHAGIHVLLTANFKTTEEELIEKAANAGIKIYPLSSYYVANSNSSRLITKPTVILGYSDIDNDNIVTGVQMLKEAWTL